MNESIKIGFEKIDFRLYLYSVMAINTWNENSLHRTLKRLYLTEDGAVAEAERDGRIYDILGADGSVTEIQTRNLGKLLPKARDALAKGRPFRIVHPVAATTTIELYDGEGNRISRRKSPKSESLYSLFDELTGLYPVLLEKNFTLEILLVAVTERRLRTEEPVQSANRRRRFRKNWLKQDRRLDEILSRRVFSDAGDYLALIPAACLPVFSAGTLGDALAGDKSLPRSAARKASVMLWVLSRMGLIEEDSRRARTRYYRIARGRAVK